jgi:hypothetical protein
LLKIKIFFQGKIQTLLHEPKFSVFYEEPIYELTQLQKEARLSMNLDEWEMKYQNLQPWPEVAYLFGEDEAYQDLVMQIMSNITYSITSISNYMRVGYSSYQTFYEILHLKTIILFF